jgi:hypothetical protein
MILESLYELKDIFTNLMSPIYPKAFAVPERAL